MHWIINVPLHWISKIGTCVEIVFFGRTAFDTFYAFTMLRNLFTFLCWYFLLFHLPLSTKILTKGEIWFYIQCSKKFFYPWNKVFQLRLFNNFKVARICNLLLQIAKLLVSIQDHLNLVFNPSFNFNVVNLLRHSIVTTEQLVFKI